MFDYIIERGNANANNRLHAGYGPLTFSVVCGDETTVVTVDGEGLRFSDGVPGNGVAFTMSASVDAWREFRRADPAPGFQTLSAMRRTQNLVVEGDMVAFFRHMMLLELLFSNLSDEVEPDDSGDFSPEIEPLTGRYLRIDIGGRRHRLYF